MADKIRIKEDLKMQVAKNFTREEFSCKCSYNCGFMVVDITLITIAQLLRNKYGVGLILSGCRCQKHNEEVGGTLNSLHMLGMAMDIKFKYGNVHEWAREIEALGFGEWVQVVKHEGDDGEWVHIELDYN